MKTLRERYITWLTAIGYERVETRSTRYVCYRKGNRYIFLGAKGSFRISQSAYRTESIALPSAMQQLLAWEKTNNGKE